MFPAETTGLDWPQNFFFHAFTFLDNITVATAFFFFFTMDVVIPQRLAGPSFISVFVLDSTKLTLNLIF